MSEIVSDHLKLVMVCFNSLYGGPGIHSHCLGQIWRGFLDKAKEHIVPGHNLWQMSLKCQLKRSRNPLKNVAMLGSHALRATALKSCLPQIISLKCICYIPMIKAISFSDRTPLDVTNNEVMVFFQKRFYLLCVCVVCVCACCYKSFWLRSSGKTSSRDDSVSLLR